MVPKVISKEKVNKVLRISRIQAFCALGHARGIATPEADDSPKGQGYHDDRTAITLKGSVGSTLPQNNSRAISVMQ